MQSLPRKLPSRQWNPKQGMPLFQLLHLQQLVEPIYPVCSCCTLWNNRNENWKKCGTTYLICLLFIITCFSMYLQDQHSEWSTCVDRTPGKHIHTNITCLIFWSNLITNTLTFSWHFIIHQAWFHAGNDASFCWNYSCTVYEYRPSIRTYLSIKCGAGNSTTNYSPINHTVESTPL